MAEQKHTKDALIKIPEKSILKPWGRERTFCTVNLDGLYIELKYLLARGNLSIQYHPTLDDNGKWEAWYILNDKTAAVADCTLRRVNLKKGTLVPIPPNTLHALCSRSFVWEVGVSLTSCPQTARVYDWGYGRHTEPAPDTVKPATFQELPRSALRNESSLQLTEWRLYDGSLSLVVIRGTGLLDLPAPRGLLRINRGTCTFYTDSLTKKISTKATYYFKQKERARLILENTEAFMVFKKF